MMHCDNIVIALVDDNKRPFREHDPERLGSSPSKRKKGEQTGRKCRVLMPFETEFKLLVKNQNDCRVMLDISIDGANVSDKGLIFDANEVGYIERSVDVAQKFKFVQAGHEDVADPTNKKNGEIVVKVWKEKKREWVYHNPIIYEPAKTPWPQNPFNPVWVSNNSQTSSTLGFDNSTVNAGASSAEPRSRSRSNIKGLRAYSASVPQGEMGAVVDGAHSDQIFGTTTWNGNDGAAIKFIFVVRGVNDDVVAQEEAELAELDRLMKKYQVK